MRPTTRTLSITALLAITTLGINSATAQTRSLTPLDYASRAGTSFDSRYPLAGGISRFQMVYANWDVGIPNNSMIKRVGFRQDEARTSIGHSIQLSIYMGSTTLDASTLTGSFASNYTGGTARTLVFGPKIVKLPDMSSTANLTEVLFDLDKKFQYKDDKNLIVEFVVTANNNANSSFNYYFDKATFYSPQKPFGTGCQSSAGTVPQLSVFTAPLGGNLTYRMSKAPASSKALLNLNVVPDTPIDMTPFGAPGCSYLVTPLANLARTGSSSGSASFTVPVPNDIAFYHVKVYAQILILDLFANNLGFVTTGAREVTIGANAGISTLRAAGSATASTGSLSRSDGIVTIFEW